MFEKQISEDIRKILIPKCVEAITVFKGEACKVNLLRYRIFAHSHGISRSNKSASSEHSFLNQ